MGQVGEMQGANMTDLSAMVRKEVNNPSTPKDSCLA